MPNRYQDYSKTPLSVGQRLENVLNAPVSPIRPSVRRTRIFVNTLTEIFNFMFSRVMGQKLPMQSPLNGSLLLNVTALRRIDLGINLLHVLIIFLSTSWKTLRFLTMPKDAIEHSGIPVYMDLPTENDLADPGSQHLFSNQRIPRVHCGLHKSLLTKLVNVTFLETFHAHENTVFRRALGEKIETNLIVLSQLNVQ